MNCALNFWNK